MSGAHRSGAVNSCKTYFIPLTPSRSPPSRPLVLPSRERTQAPQTAAAVRFEVLRCAALKPRHGARHCTPYVSYQFPGFPVHDTHFARGVDPVFDDARTFPLARTVALEERLASTRLEVRERDAIVRMLRATWWSLTAIVWMLRAT
eukprot:5286425-Pyramimonas_sp.AAC.1